jgi:hypothetical protein
MINQSNRLLLTGVFYKILLYWIALYPLVNMAINRITGEGYYVYMIPFTIILVLGALVQSIVVNRRLRFPMYLVFFTMFTVYQLLWAAFLRAQDQSLGSTSVSSQILRDGFVRAWLLLLLMENIEFTRKDFWRMIVMFAICFSFGAVVSIIQIGYDPSFMINLSGRSMRQLDSEAFTIRNPSIYFWGYGRQELGLSIPPLVAILTPFIRNRRSLLFLIIVSTAIMIGLNLARYSMLTYLIALMSLPLASQVKLKRFFSYTFFTILTIGLVYLVIRIIGLNPYDFYQNRLLAESYRTRFLAFEVFSKFFRENMMFGTGGTLMNDVVQEISGMSSHIHVGWLSLLYYYGLVGGVIYITFIILLLRELYRIGVRSNYWGVFLALVTFIVANGTGTSLTFNYSGLMFMILVKNYMNRFHINVTQTDGSNPPNTASQATR